MVSLLPCVEFGPNDHRENALHFKFRFTAQKMSLKKIQKLVFQKKLQTRNFLNVKSETFSTVNLICRLRWPIRSLVPYHMTTLYFRILAIDNNHQHWQISSNKISKAVVVSRWDFSSRILSFEPRDVFLKWNSSFEWAISSDFWVISNFEDTIYGWENKKGSFK